MQLIPLTPDSIRSSLRHSSVRGPPCHSHALSPAAARAEYRVTGRFRFFPDYSYPVILRTLTVIIRTRVVITRPMQDTEYATVGQFRTGIKDALRQLEEEGAVTARNGVYTKR